MKDDVIRIGDGSGGAILTPGGDIRRVECEGRGVEPALPWSHWEIDGEQADAKVSPRGEAAAELRLAAQRLSLRLRLQWKNGLRISTEEGSAETLSLSLAFAEETRFHLPERYNACRTVDRDMPLHDLYEAELRYNFFIAETASAWVLFHLNQTAMDVPSLCLSRQPGLFTATFRCKPAHEVRVSLHGSLEDAMQTYETWLSEEMEITPLRDDPTVPGWVHDTKLVITLDMMRSNWKIAHDYADVAALADELGACGCPADTLFYLPGTNGAYDAMYPDHGPHPELGGAEGFRRMVDALHRNGFRVMLHANAWGLDPCHPEVEKYLPYVLKDEEGGYEGWQTGGTIWGGLTMPPSYSLKYRIPPLPVTAVSDGEPPLSGSASEDGFSFDTEHIPNECEALLSFGVRGAGRSMPGGARIRLTTNHRSYLTPEGWFAENDAYDFPFPFLLEAGKNRFRVELVGGGKLDPGDCWYRVRRCFTFVQGCTYPILRADTTNPEWIRIFLDKITSVVREYGIDAVHVDATHYHRDARILEALKEEIPQCIISGEELESMGDLKMFGLCQNAQLSLLAGIETRRLRRSRYYLSERGEVERSCRWLDRPSPVWRYLRKHVILYPHLCAPDGFVPVGKVCGIRPPVQTPEDPARLWEVLRDAGRLGYVPGLRLNYREHGLDAESRKAIQELGGAGD